MINTSQLKYIFPYYNYFKEYHFGIKYRFQVLVLCVHIIIPIKIKIVKKLSKNPDKYK